MKGGVKREGRGGGRPKGGVDQLSKGKIRAWDRPQEPRRPGFRTPRGGSSSGKGHARGGIAACFPKAFGGKKKRGQAQASRIKRQAGEDDTEMTPDTGLSKRKKNVKCNGEKKK